jgi:hypothetical protein
MSCPISSIVDADDEPPAVTSVQVVDGKETDTLADARRPAAPLTKNVLGGIESTDALRGGQPTQLRPPSSQQTSLEHAEGQVLIEVRCVICVA